MTAPAEPGVVDTNVLIFALDADSPHHKAARNLVEAARDGAITLYVTSQILCEFVAKPRGSAEALDVIAGLLSFLHVLPVLAHAVTGWMSLLRRCPVTGGDVFDLQIVATMLASDVSRIYTFNNAEFEMFSELAVISP